MQNICGGSDENITISPLILLQSVRALNKEINPTPPVGRKPVAFDKPLLTHDPLQGFTPSHFIHKLSLEAVDIHIQLKTGGKTKPGGCTLPHSFLTSEENERLWCSQLIPLHLIDTQWQGNPLGFPYGQGHCGWFLPSLAVTGSVWDGLLWTDPLLSGGGRNRLNVV